MILNLLNPILTGAASSTLSDEEAVRLYLETHNINYFNLIYDRYSDKVFAKCISILRHQTDAEDAVQDIFVKLLLNLSGYNGSSRFSTWLYSITYNLCIDHVRKQRKTPIDLSDDISQYANRQDNIEDHRLTEVKVQKLKEILDEMQAEDKSILLMKYLDDMSIREICSVVNKSESAVKMRIFRAKDRFVKIYEQLYQDREVDEYAY